MSAHRRFKATQATSLGGSEVAWLASLAGAAAAFCLFRAVAPWGPSDPSVAHSVGFGSVVAATLAASRYAPMAASRRFPLSGPVAAILGAGLLLWLAQQLGSRGWLSALTVFIALLGAGSVLGAFVGARIEHPGHLLFVATASALADIFSVTQPHGPSAAIVRSEAALHLLALSWPMLGSAHVAPLLGVGDVVFTALYLAAARRHELPIRRTLMALAIAYGVTMLAVFSWRAAVPALPFLGAGMLIAHPRTWRVPQRDRRRGWVALSVITVVFIALVVWR